jgi:hypothetical protein
MPVIDKLERKALINFWCARIPSILRIEPSVKIVFIQKTPYKPLRLQKTCLQVQKIFLSDNPDAVSKVFLISEIFNKDFASFAFKDNILNDLRVFYNRRRLTIFF